MTFPEVVAEHQRTGKEIICLSHIFLIFATADENGTVDEHCLSDKDRTLIAKEPGAKRILDI